MDFDFYEVPFGYIVEQFGMGYEMQENVFQPDDNFRQLPFGPSPTQSPIGPPKNMPPFSAPSKPKSQSLGIVDPRAIRRCLFRFTYIWLRNGRSFWIYLTFVGRHSIAGWRWNGRRWVYVGIDIDRIESFICN